MASKTLGSSLLVANESKYETLKRTLLIICIYRIGLNARKIFKGCFRLIQMNNLHQNQDLFYQLQENAPIQLFEGRTYVVPFKISFAITSSLLTVPFGLHMALDFSFYNLLNRFLPIIVDVSILSVIVYVLYHLSLTQPGIIKKITGIYQHQEELLRVPVNNFIIQRNSWAYSMGIGAFHYKIKFCKTCQIYRPPRSVHCDICGFCVQHYDHHSAILGVCIGKRNFNYFYTLIVLSLCSAITNLITSFQIMLTVKPQYFLGYKSYPFTVISCVFSLLLLAIAGYYFATYTYLLIIGESYSQSTSKTWSTLAGNPNKINIYQRIINYFSAEQTPTRFTLNSILHYRSNNQNEIADPPDVLPISRFPSSAVSSISIPSDKQSQPDNKNIVQQIFDMISQDQGQQK